MVEGIDRVLIDILDWLRRLLWGREGVTKDKPYTVLEPAKRGKYALITKVLRPTPRAVATYIISPLRFDLQPREIEDYHLCCDHLGAIEGEGAIGGRGAKAKTHRISVYRASHWLLADGTYNCKSVFWADYDLQRQDPNRDRQAVQVMARIALSVRNLKPEAIDWQWEVETAIKEVLGGKWRSSGSAPAEAQETDWVIEGTRLDPIKRKMRITVKREKGDRL